MKSLLGNKLLPIALAVAATWVGVAEHRFNSVKGYLETAQLKSEDLMRLNVAVQSESEMRLMEEALMELSVNYSKTDTGDGWVLFIESTYDKVKMILGITGYKSASLILEPPEGIFENIVNSGEIGMRKSGDQDQEMSIKREVAIWSLSEEGDIINVNLNSAIFSKVGVDVYLNEGNFKNAIRRTQADQHVMNYEEVSLENSHSNTRVDPNVTMGAFSDHRRDYAVKIKMPVDFYEVVEYQRNSDFEVQRDIIESIYASIIDKYFKGRGIEFKYLSGTNEALVTMNKDELEYLISANDKRIIYIGRDDDSIYPILNQSTGSIAGGLDIEQTWNSGARGKNTWIALIDSGVTLSNSEFSGERSYLQACFNTNDPRNNRFSTCLQADQSGSSPRVYSGRGGTYSNPCGRGRASVGGQAPTDDATCKHGDFVAAIALGAPPRLPDYKGVSYESNIFAINVGSLESVAGTNERSATIEPNDVKKALDAIAKIGNSYNFVVNASVGSKNTFSGTCDNLNATATQLIRTLKYQYKIPVIAGTGNSGSKGGISWPACVSNVVKVIATRKDTGGIDYISNFADKQNFNGPWWLAPGRNIAVPFNGIVSGLQNGTSMAAPHIAGVYSLIRGVVPETSVDDVTNFMETCCTPHYESVLTQPSGTMTSFRRFRFN